MFEKCQNARPGDLCPPLCADVPGHTQSMDASDRIDWRKNVSSLSMSSLIKQGLDTKVKPVEADMKKALPIILILLGIAELIIALMDIKLPVVIAVVLGALFIVLGVKTLLDPDKKE